MVGLHTLASELESPFVSDYLVPVSCASVVNNDINLAKFLVCGFHNCLPVASLGDIGANELSLDLAGGLLANFFCKVGNDNFSAFLNEFLCDAFETSVVI